MTVSSMCAYTILKKGYEGDVILGLAIISGGQKFFFSFADFLTLVYYWHLY